MQLSLREKAGLYDHLGRLIRSGITFPVAVEKLAATSRGNVRRCLKGLKDGVDRGETIAEAFNALRPAVGEMECSTLSALERTGRLEHGLAQLGRYFQAFATARREILQRSAYPLVVLHIGILLLNVPLLFTDAAGQYLKSTGLLLAALYGAVAIIALLLPLVRDAGTASPVVDRILRFIPIIGPMRRSFALARFIGVYDLQLDAGVNVIDGLLAAARASRSAAIRRAVQSAIPELRDGSQVGPLLARSGVFPEETMRAIQIAEDTGELDVVLEQLAVEHQGEGLRRLGVFSEWLPRLVYLGVVVFVAWQVISGYRNYLEGVMRQFDTI